MRYAIYFAPAAVAKDLPSLDRETLARVQEMIVAKLAVHPELFGKPLRHSLKHHRALRVGDYRIVYRVEGNAVRIVAVIHRSSGYDGLVARV